MLEREWGTRMEIFQSIDNLIQNYKDKPEIIEIVKNVGIAFVPKNLQEIKEIKEISINGYGKIRERSIEIAK